MKHITKAFLLLVLTACASTPCANQRTPSEALYVSEAVSTQGLFSAGIEGPAVDKQGNLYVVNFGDKGTIGILRPGKEPELWLQLPEGSIGNSIRFDRDGRMYVADYKKHHVFLIDTATKKIEVLFQKNEMNQPNDMAINSQGVIYMSDPSWRDRKKGGIWIFSGGVEPQMAAAGLSAANGIDIHPSEETVFFGDSISGMIYSMRIQGNALVDKKSFYKFEPDTIDGIRFDAFGNLYVARIQRGSIDVISPTGQLLRSVPLLGKNPTNIAFGGKDGKTVYVTMKDGGYIESFRVEFPGREWDLQNRK